MTETRDGEANARLRVLYIEPYDGGSHAAFTRTLTSHTADIDWTTLTLPGRYWKWRMRGSAMHFATAHHEVLRSPHDLLFASSYLPLAELYGLVPELAGTPSALYFHENQLAYPVREAHSGPRDHHFGFTQLVSAWAATGVAFNSDYNRRSFLDAARALFKKLPDPVPPGWIEAIEERSVVLPVPVELPELTPDVLTCAEIDRSKGPILLWNHRWEYDKDPEALFEALYALQRKGIPFRLILCGERFKKSPRCMDEGYGRLQDHIVHWGYAPTREGYLRLLSRAHVAVSTAIHEFFGISVIEAVHYGARPLVPDRLAYPERFPARYRYRSDDPSALTRALTDLCTRWVRGELPLREDRRALVAEVEASRVLADVEAWMRSLTHLRNQPRFQK